MVTILPTGSYQSHFEGAGGVLPRGCSLKVVYWFKFCELSVIIGFIRNSSEVQLKCLILQMSLNSLLRSVAYSLFRLKGSLESWLVT